MRTHLAAAALVALIAAAGSRVSFAQEEEDQLPPRVLRVYDVSDLTMKPYDFSRCGIGISWQMGPFAGGDVEVDEDGNDVVGYDPDIGTVQDGVKVTFYEIPDVPDDVPDDEEADEATPQERLYDLVGVIRYAIEPGSWDDSGGTAIGGWDGKLVVIQDEATQKKVQEFLATLRNVVKTQYAVRVRFVTPKKEDIDRITDGKLSLATTAAQKAKLLELTGPAFADARFVGLMGRKAPLSTWRPDSDSAGLVGWARAMAGPDDLLRVDVDVRLALPAGDGGVASIAFVSGYALPEGAMLLTSGATIGDGWGKREVYALIEVQRIEPPAAP